MPDEGVYARIPVAELSLSDAYAAVDDVSFWDETMPLLLDHFKIGLDDYYKLTVYQHRLLVDYLASKGLHA